MAEQCTTALSPSQNKENSAQSWPEQGAKALSPGQSCVTHRFGLGELLKKCSVQTTNLEHCSVVLSRPV
jgi:hypothetical protein